MLDSNLVSQQARLLPVPPLQPYAHDPPSPDLDCLPESLLPVDHVIPGPEEHGLGHPQVEEAGGQGGERRSGFQLRLLE